MTSSSGSSGSSTGASEDGGGGSAGGGGSGGAGGSASGAGGEAAAGGGPEAGGGQQPSPPAEQASPGAAPTAGATEQPALDADLIGSGGDATAATSRHGEGTIRNDALRQAARNVNGDLVGNKYVFLHGGAGGTVTLRLMAPSLLECAASAFAFPPGWEELLVAQAKSRILVLRGRVGHGKTAAAIRLLLGRDADPIYHVSGTDLANLAEALQARDADEGADRGQLRGAGFVLDDPAEFAALQAGVLRGIEAALHGAQAHLVIAVGSAEPIRDQALLDFTVDLAGFPDRREVLLAHLGRVLEQEHAAELLGRIEIGKLVDAHLTEDTPCSGIVSLAVALADDELAGAADPDRVRERLSQRGSADFEAWFAQLPDAESRCHAVALAVLGGASQETVTRAARSLYQRLVPRGDLVLASSANDESAVRDPFRRTQGALFSLLRARTRADTVRGPYGPSPIRAVEYRDPAYPSAVLRHVWTQYAIQEDLLEWLAELVDDSSYQVRVLAGSALGGLSLLSFEYLREQILGPWASSPQPTQREAVAYALRVAADDRDLLPCIRGMTAWWYANADDRAAQATAARVHGLSQVSRDPVAAVDALVRLLVVDNLPLALAIGNALTDLLVDGSTELAAYVLAKLAAAARERRTAPAAELVFLLLNVQISIDHAPRAAAADGAAPGPGVSWPFLLSLAGARPDVRDHVIRLWQAVLESALFHREAEQVLSAWAGWAQNDTALGDAFLRLVRAVAYSHPHSARVLRKLADDWVDPEKLAPLREISAALRHVLPKEGT